MERREGKSPLVVRKSNELLLHKTSSLGCLNLLALEERNVSPGVTSSESKRENTSQESDARKFLFLPCVWAEVRATGSALNTSTGDIGGVQPFVFFRSFVLVSLNSACPSIQILKRKYEMLNINVEFYLLSSHEQAKWPKEEAVLWVENIQQAAQALFSFWV